MDTTEILVTVPTWNEAFGWLVFYLWCGVVVYVVYAVGFVACDYGRTASRTSVFASLLDMIAAIVAWPFMYRYIRDNLSYRRFNRPYSYYR